MKKIISFCLVVVLLLGGIAPTAIGASNEAPWEVAMHQSLNWIEQSLAEGPRVGSVGGEWAILALARAGRICQGSPWLDPWFADLDRLLVEVDGLVAAGHSILHPPSTGTFPAELRRQTDFQRVTIALSALGADATNVNGRDLTQVYRTFTPRGQRHALNQTINADSYALIALNTGGYGGDTTQFLQAILETQRADGSFGLIPQQASSAFDVDMTAMVVQALAPYYRAGNAPAVLAVGRALGWLRTQTFIDPESTAQMIVALTELGSTYRQEAGTYVAHLLAWHEPETGAFRRPYPTSPRNQMATEQAAYALVAYWRMVNHMTSLYDMRDVVGRGQTGSRHPDVGPVPITHPGRTFPDIQGTPHQTAIETLAARGIILGRGDNSFAPNDTMTRAEFAAIITRALSLPNRTANISFLDVPANVWYTRVVETAFYYGIVNGTSATSFSPYGTITRQEAALMVARAARLAGINTDMNHAQVEHMLGQFEDGHTVATWTRGELAFLLCTGILRANGNTISPQAQIQRGEIAQMLFHLLGQANLL